MPRPLIGITTYVEESTRYNVWDLPTALVPSGYYELVQAAGGAASCCRRTNRDAPRRC